MDRQALSSMSERSVSELDARRVLLPTLVVWSEGKALSRRLRRGGVARCVPTGCVWGAQTVKGFRV